MCIFHRITRRLFYRTRRGEVFLFCIYEKCTVVPAKMKIVHFSVLLTSYVSCCHLCGKWPPCSANSSGDHFCGSSSVQLFLFPPRILFPSLGIHTVILWLLLMRWPAHFHLRSFASDATSSPSP